MQYKLGFIGCGNMGGALLAACAKKVDGKEIAACDHNEKKVLSLQKQYGVAVASAEDIAKNADFVVLGVKPQAMQDTLSPIAEILRAREEVTLVTMAAGLSISGLCAMIGKELPTVRIMPNTPVLLGAGMVLYALSGVSERKKATFLEYFEKVGVLDFVEEKDIDGGSALSGCGPAFVYAFAEALIKGGVACGVAEEKAALYAAQTLKGAAEMLLQFGDPVPLRKAVCSPNGTTIEGVHFLEENGFFDTVEGAVKASYKRTLELKK